MSGVVAGGIILVELGWWFMGWSFSIGINYFGQNVFSHFPVHSRLEAFLVVILVNSGMHLYRLTVSMLIGCIVALLSKRREMVATLAVSLVCSIPALTRFLLFFLGTKLYGTGLLYLSLYFFGGLFALVVGGAVVKSHRVRSFRALSS